MEYGSRTEINHLKHQREQLANAAGQPIVIFDCYETGDIIAVAGNYQESTDDNCIVITTPQGTSKQLLEQGNELLVGFEAIDEYVESALERYEDESDVYAGITAVSLIDRFSGHFPPLPHELTGVIAKQVCGSDNYEDYLGVLDAGDIMKAQVHSIMTQFIQSFASPEAALRSNKVTAYIRANTDPYDPDAPLEFLLACRRATTQ